jgi:hypothetical protein
MTTRRHREFLRNQLLETERLQQLAGDHPLMSVAYAERVDEVRKALEAVPAGQKEARTVLFFSGKPVQGSVGIDANFAGRVLEPFQNMVMADYADRWHGTVGSRGRRPGEAESRLLLTGLPRGSFGLELSKADSDELFEEGQLADTLAHVTRLVESASRSDEDFASELDETAPRVIQNLKDFLGAVAKGDAGLRLETGDFRCTLSPIQANEAFERVSGTITNDEPLEQKGVFKGLLLESWKFDFVNDDGHKISGKVDDNLTLEQVEAMAREFFNRECTASLMKTTVLFKNGRIRTTYTLRNLAALS